MFTRTLFWRVDLQNENKFTLAENKEDECVMGSERGLGGSKSRILLEWARKAQDGWQSTAGALQKGEQADEVQMPCRHFRSGSEAPSGCLRCFVPARGPLRACSVPAQPQPQRQYLSGLGAFCCLSRLNNNRNREERSRLHTFSPSLRPSLRSIQ